MFRNMKIGLRLGLGFCLMIVFMIVLIAVGINAMKRINAELETIVKVENVRTQLANNMIDQARETALDVRNILLLKYNKESSERIQEVRDHLAETRKTYNENYAKLEGLLSQEETQKNDLHDKLHASGDSARLLQDKVIELALGGKLSAATELMYGKAYPTVQRWIQCTDNQIRSENARTLLRFGAAQKLYADVRTSMFTLGALAIALAMMISFFLTISIARPLSVISTMAARTAAGDLNVNLTTGKHKDEVGAMTQSLQNMTEKLRSVSLYTRNLIEASLDLLVTISPEGKITDVNEATIKITGVSRDKLIGTDFSNYFTEPDKARKGYQQVFAKGSVIDYPLTIRQRDGKLVDVLYNASVYKDSNGKVVGVFAAARDITELKKRTAELTNVLSEVKDTVNVLTATSSEILAATTQVASSTAENASAISETTTTVEEVRQAAQLSSDKAKNVSDSAQRVKQISQTGQKAVEETATGMRHIREQMESIAQTIVRLSEQGQSIGGIISSVTDIADQSNLLAVNAAIEAARAGEQGKAFAVVAQEIKSLAEQSKQATTQVRTILNDVQKATSAAVMATEQGSKAVEAGVKQSAQAGEAIRVLAESSSEAVQVTTQIVASSQQQVVGMNQIGTAMENVNQAGAETAASMKQAETAAKNLHELGQKLKGLVEQFKA